MTQLDRIDRRGRTHTFVLWALIVWLFARECLSQEQPQVLRPDLAVALALRDAKALAAQDATAPLVVRYVAGNLPSEELRAGLAFAANLSLLHGAEPIQPRLVGSALYALDLSAYADYDATRLRLLLDTWERMSDPQYFLPTDKVKTVRSPRWFHKGTGKAWESVSIRVVIPAAHADANGQLTELVTLTASAVPIISVGQFLRFALNTEAGGLYAEFRQIDQSPAKGTAEQAFLARAGVDLDDLGARNADQRVALFRTPTAQPGIIEYVPAAATRPSVGPTIATITRDYFSGPIGQNAHPFENLAGRKHDGSEIFVPTPAGGLDFALFNADGGFVKSAPPNLAADRTIPAPFLPILQGASGCIRCHLLTNPDTKVFGIYQAAPNYVTSLREVDVAGYRFDVFAEGGDAGAALARLVSLYNGETDDAFAYAGQTFAKFAFRASGVPLETAAAAMMGLHDQHLYAFVTPSKALLTLGYSEPDDAKAVQLFNQLVPPAPEPLRVTQLRAWTKEKPIRISIDDWLQVYPEIALRVAATEAARAAQANPFEEAQE